MDALAPVSRLRGVGPKGAEALAARGITCVGDLPWLLPVSYDDLRAPLDVAAAVALAGERPRVAVRGTVRSASMAFVRGRRSVRVVLAGEPDGPKGRAPVLTAWWFFLAHGILAVAKPGTRVVLSGRLSPAKQGGSAAMSHPDLVVDAGEPLGVRARYARVGLPPKALERAIRAALEVAPARLDPVPPDVAARESMAPLGDALTRVHRPDAPPDGSLLGAVRERLAWAEAFTRAWDRAAEEGKLGARSAPALPPKPAAVERLRLELGFSWTAGQERALAEIAADLASERPMRRLLFGDVGAGKTAVALAAAAQAVAAGAQVAILAPTSVLAEQYLEGAGPLARAQQARVALLTSVTRAAERRHLARAVAEGAVDVVVGTHALLSDDLAFKRLGLVVVDEQQRLGVGQRLSLVRKGDASAEATRPHLLTLSATPIPRTLALALRGELATSELEGKPPGRSPVETRAVPRSAYDAVVLPAIRSAIDAGGRVFVVCPRIGGDEDDDAASEIGPSCLAVAEAVAGAVGEQAVAVVHGGLAPAATSAAMGRFRTGKASVLVGTTVVEVGVDVPEATLMVVDGAEHFGLAQLHQLRGRVGRGTTPSSCLLVHDEPLGPDPRARLDALGRLHGGLAIAREDLRLRGAGDLGGTRQSGREGLVWLDPLAEPAWLAHLGDDVARLRAEDPELARPEHLGLRLATSRLRAELAIREEAG